ncbi:efflux RND transporter periplasmic adaptor subunit [bacterium]|nr:efflux RND transporter periplasmic adaptor subunit [bacterium]
MKIDWKSKKAKIIACILAVILVPTLWNQGKTIVMSILTNYMMNQPKVVQVSKPILRDIQPTFDTTGRIEANLSVDIIARVNGWLQKKYFEEGDRVTKGQKLFLIEPNEYILASQNARATVNENSAVYKNSQIDLQRAEQLLKDDLVSREYYDNALTQRNRNRAALDGAIAQMKQADLNLSYTNITSPMNGRIGKVNISVGNYVTPSSGAIAQIYSTNPMKVIFPLNSGDFIELKKYYISASEEDKNDENAVSVLLGLADGTQYEIEGKIEFVDNKIDESTGTVTLRAIFENPDEILVPGDYVKVTIRINKPYKVMMIPQSATKTDIGTGYYVWVVKDGEVVKKDIKVNQNIDNNWIVESGLDENDEVVVNGIQDIYKTGQKVKPIPYTEDKTEEKAEDKK